MNQTENTLTLPQTRFQSLRSTMVHPGGRDKDTISFIHLHSYPPLNMNQSPSVSQSVCPSVHTWECPPVCPYLRVSIRLSIPESVHLSVHTWECPVSSVDPQVQQSAASPLSLLDDCSSGPALSDGRGWSLELRPEKHSLPLWLDILTDCRHRKPYTSHDLRSLQDWKCLLLLCVYYCRHH